MTTFDIAGLCERLREEARKLRTQKERGPAFHFPWGQDIIDANNATAAAFEASADILERQAAEIERLRGALEPFAKAAALFDAGDYVNHDACIYRPAAGDEYSLSSGHLLAARAALTGEDTAGSPTNQNTEPGLAFSAPVELSGNPGEPKPLMTAQELADHAADAFDDALPDDALPHEVGRAWKAVGERLAAILAERAKE